MDGVSRIAFDGDATGLYTIIDLEVAYVITIAICGPGSRGDGTDLMLQLISKESGESRRIAAATDATPPASCLQTAVESRF